MLFYASGLYITYYKKNLFYFEPQKVERLWFLLAWDKTFRTDPLYTYSKANSTRVPKQTLNRKRAAYYTSL